MNVLIVVVTLFVLTAFAAQSGYEGNKVYRLKPTGKKQLEMLANLRNEKNLDFWTPLRRDEHPVDVMVNFKEEKWLTDLLKKNNITYDTLIDDVDSAVLEEHERQIFFPPTKQGRISFIKYHRHEEINAYLSRLAKDYPNLVSIQNIGKSYEGRDLDVIQISTNSSAGKPVIFIDAGIHAREWIAPAVALYAINQLVENKDNANLLEKVDWNILPVLNPDGYEYTHSTLLQRFWRKTRSQGNKCIGADANRNFDFHWAEIGSSSDECDDTYHGKHAFSEIEAIALSNYISQNKNRIKLYLTLHSFGQLILYPWGYTSELPRDNEELLSLGEAVAESIKNVSGTNYIVGSSTNILYAAAGGSDDWAKGVAGVELSYTIELPGGGLLGFDLPTWKILGVAKETWEGLKTFCKHISEKFN
ncbi:hypothetical protein ILUMI_09720 [Ignelater luminosus]|uniref:Zinc carboxypeptidase A 1 n=1 Tax=Ignelater luminosus TaxID=2038154 RepID=A0A8K0D8K3_IGNLU|nr:hypothetical protein ILUMI_09720 [Ignelater luminosus]